MYARKDTDHLKLIDFGLSAWGQHGMTDHDVMIQDDG